MSEISRTVEPALAPGSSKVASSENLTASEKALQVLHAAVLHARFTDIVTASGMPKATVHRILTSLVDQHFFVEDETEGYKPGPRLIEISGLVMRDFDISTIAQPYVNDLRDKVQNTIHVGVVNGDEMLYLIRSDSPKPYEMRSRVGATVPLYATGMGKCVLADKTDAEIRAYAERVDFRRYTANTITSHAALRAELEWVSENGYAMDLEENEEGVVCISAPIRDHLGRVRYGVSVSSITLEYPNKSIETLAADVIETARQISAALGAPAL